MLHYWVYSNNDVSKSPMDSPAAETLPRCMSFLSPAQARQVAEETINWTDPLAARPDDAYRRSIRLLQNEECLNTPLIHGMATVEKLAINHPEVMRIKIPDSPNLLEGLVKACKRQLCLGGNDARAEEDTIIVTLGFVL